MQIPKEALAPLAAIAAASIAGTVTFVVAVLSKENKTSEFRQAWIDGIRTDISDFLSLIGTIATSKKKTIESLNPEEMPHNKFENQAKVDFLLSRIILRLNPSEHQNLIQSLREIKLSVKKDAIDPHYVDNVLKHVEPIINLSHSLFQKEWRRVKRGEPPYIITKYVSLSLAALLLIFATLLYFGVFGKISLAEEKSSPTRMNDSGNTNGVKKN